MAKGRNSATHAPAAGSAAPPVGVAGSVAARLGSIGSPRAWRRVLAAVVGALVAAGVQGGLITFLPWWQVGLIAGLAVGLIAPDVVAALVTGALGAGVAGLIGPENAWVPFAGAGERFVAATTAAAAAALIAAGVRYVVERRWLSPRVLMWLAVGLMVANLWATTLVSNTQGAFDPMTQAQMPSFNEQLAGWVPAAIADSDDAWFFGIVAKMRAGVGYYDAMHEALVANDNWVGSSPIAYRLPTVFWALAAVPPTAVPLLFLLLASVAVFVVPFVSFGVARAPVSLIAAASLSSYFVYFPVQLTLFSQEQWALALAVIAAAAFAASLRAHRYRTLVVAAVVAAVLSALVRETAVFVLLAGALAVSFAPKERRAFEGWAWGAGLASFVVLYAAHWVRASSILETQSGPGGLAGGGVTFAIAALEYATDMLGAGGPWPHVFAAIGILGVLIVPDARLRTFGAVAGLAPLATFLFVGNRAWYASTGSAINYWGGTVTALLYAFVPMALLVLPGAAMASAEAKRGRA